MQATTPAQRRSARGRCRGAVVVSAVLLVLAGCASPFASWQGDRPPERATYVGVELVRQDAQRNCGAAALVSVMRYWDTPASLDAVSRRHPPEEESGYSVGELLRIARANGLRAFAFEMPHEFLRVQLRNGRPLIVPIAKPTVWAGIAELPLVGRAYTGLAGTDGLYLAHYVTLVGYDEGRYYLLDPDDGHRKVAEDELAKMRAAFGNAGILVGRHEPREK